MFKHEIVQLANEALWLVLVLSAPPILISLMFGLIVAIFQAATQIQEQSLSFTVKLVTAIITLILAGSWIGGQLLQYSLTIFKDFHRWSG